MDTSYVWILFCRPSAVSRGLRQGCVLSPVFSLYVNSLVEKLRGAKVGVECRGRMVTALLHADDAILLAENEEQVRRGLV